MRACQQISWGTLDCSTSKMADYIAKTDNIGDTFQREYGHKDPNTHILYFYVRLGLEILHIKDEIMIEALDTLLGQGNWKKPVPGWQGILIFKYDCQHKSEREREVHIDKQVRQPLMAHLKQIPISSSIHIMFSRACLYTDSSKDNPSSDVITTDKIGAVFENVYRDLDMGNAHIEYFYLFVQAKTNEECFVKKEINGKVINVQDMAIRELKDLPGEWRSVEPQDTWLGTFFGFYPKGMRELSEREREKRLNGEVRKPLIEKLQAKLLGMANSDTKLSAHVIMTRACKYTPTN